MLASASWKVIPQVLKGYKSSVYYWFIAYLVLIFPPIDDARKGPPTYYQLRKNPHLSPKLWRVEQVQLSAEKTQFRDH